MSDEKQQWHLQWVHFDFGNELYASGDGKTLIVAKVDYDQSTVTVFMRAWRQVLGMPLIGKEAAEIVYDKTSENPDCIIVDFLRTMHRFRVLLQLHDLLERAADHEPGWGHEDSRFVLKTMLRELTLR